MSSKIEIIKIPSTDQIVVKGDENDLNFLRQLFSQKPHLFVVCGEIKEGQMSLSFPSATSQAVEFFLEDFVNQS